MITRFTSKLLQRKSIRFIFSKRYQFSLRNESDSKFNESNLKQNNHNNENTMQNEQNTYKNNQETHQQEETPFNIKNIIIGGVLLSWIFLFQLWFSSNKKTRDRAQKYYDEGGGLDKPLNEEYRGEYV